MTKSVQKVLKAAVADLNTDGDTALVRLLVDETADVEPVLREDTPFAERDQEADFL